MNSIDTAERSDEAVAENESALEFIQKKRQFYNDLANAKFGDDLDEIEKIRKLKNIAYRKYTNNVKHRRRSSNVHRICTKHESLDYDKIENKVVLHEQVIKGYGFLTKKNGLRWFIFLLIGLITAEVAVVINIIVEVVIKFKFKIISASIDANAISGQLYTPLTIWIVLNALPVILAATLIVYFAPIAGGSGIPYVKCYLNGISLPSLITIQTLAVKVVGVICSIIGGLAGGKEGPMIHVGAVVGAGLADWKLKFGKKEYRWFKYFNVDHEKRDFVSAGAAAGVAAAFGGPVGGLLFVLEEGASFWNQTLTWRIFFASVISTFAIDYTLSSYHGDFSGSENRGSLNLGHFQNFDYKMQEIPIFIAMGCIGGFLGSGWVYLNYKLSVLRKMYLSRRKVYMVVEAAIIASCSAAISFATVYLSQHCKIIEIIPTEFPTQMYCADGEASVFSAIWFQTPEGSVRFFLHTNERDAIPITVILIFSAVYYLLSCWTYGMACSLGLVVSSLLCGAAWGRLIGILLGSIIDPDALGDLGKFALIGACAQLGGVVRMTLSLTVIIMETTGNTNIGFPVVITLMCAKWTADSFIKSIYDIIIRMGGYPFLYGEAPPFLTHIIASEIMSLPVTTLKSIEKVEVILQVLKSTTYNGFPIVDPVNQKTKSTQSERLRGLILRSQILCLISHKIFVEYMIDWTQIPSNVFVENPPLLKNLVLTDEEKTYTVDFRPFMNPTPYAVSYSCSFTRCFQLLRALGLRHLPVVDDSNNVIGMLSRKDIAKHRSDRTLCKMWIEETYLDTI